MGLYTFTFAHYNTAQIPIPTLPTGWCHPMRALAEAAEAEKKKLPVLLLKNHSLPVLQLFTTFVKVRVFWGSFHSALNMGITEHTYRHKRCMDLNYQFYLAKKEMLLFSLQSTRV